ncbi:hypothetical protein [[Clostridium] fimetarium]|uniref:Uncharacterized protein n=1 Tax=[Clostridium] fimetarium TaxID=99656 RepID=A0A1I0QWM4_9FIRM|nr:hypothetical protein [[Clostridium] fimetarium]SEW31910.1 hypothetical protein SAMN05421659_109198 [[Clostridium] fimetarium]
MKILFDIIGTVGGIGVIIAALAGFFSKFWADAFMNKKIAEYDKQIELYKNSLALETEKYKSLNEQIIYKNMKIFDIEFSIYQEITPLVMKVRWAAIRAMGTNPNKDFTEEHSEAKEKCHELREKTLKNISFMDKDIYKIYEAFYFLCMNSMGEVRKFDFEADKHFAEVCVKIVQIEQASDDIVNITREYLRSMATIK